MNREHNIDFFEAMEAIGLPVLTMQRPATPENNEITTGETMTSLRDCPFSRIEGHRDVMNVIVPVNKHFRLSVSYGGAAGTIGHYSVAIQAQDTLYPGVVDLVSFAELTYRNMWVNCDDRTVGSIQMIASKLDYAGAIEVYDVHERNEGTRWGVRFLCAEGFDLNDKLAYCDKMWDPTMYRRAPASP